MAAFGCIPAVVAGLGLERVPESPRWLASVGRLADARAEAEKLFGEGVPLEEAASSGDAELISRPVFVGVGVVVCFVATGNNARRGAGRFLDARRGSVVTLVE